MLYLEHKYTILVHYVNDTFEECLQFWLLQVEIFDKKQILKWCVMILVLISWFHIEDMISYNRKIWKVYVAKKKNIGVSTIFTVKTNRR
jgi:hypothetical protein